MLNFELKMNFPRKGEEAKAGADNEEIKDEIKVDPGPVMVRNTPVLQDIVPFGSATQESSRCFEFSRSLVQIQ